MDWRYYEDIEVGEERKSKFLTITEKEIIDFAEKYDPQWFHSDPEESKKSSFKGLIASGILLQQFGDCLIMMQMVILSLYVVLAGKMWGGRTHLDLMTKFMYGQNVYQRVKQHPVKEV